MPDDLETDLDVGELTGPPLYDAEHPGFSADEFRASFGEELSQTLDLTTWRTGINLDEEYRRLAAEVQLAVGQESDYQRRIRDEIFPRIAWGDAPPGAGVYEIPKEDIEAIHRGLLFNGGVEACDGSNQIHDTLPLTIHQIAVSLVSYAGDRGTWHQRLFRRDLRFQNGDPTQEILELLERRGRRSAVNHSAPTDAFSELFQRALMSYAERAILLRNSKAVWRLGHGSPAPLELLTGGGLVELMAKATTVIRELVDHKKFIFVASEPKERALMTIGHALRPLEYAIVQTLEDRIGRLLDMVKFHDSGGAGLRWDGVQLTPERWLTRFRDEVAPRVVVGIYRASLWAPPQVFYAHVDQADLAVRIAVADSVLQQERGFPLLIDLADNVCRSIYGGGSLQDLSAGAYAASGVPWRYLSERATRPDR